MLTDTDGIRVGIIGAGRMGRTHAECWAAVPGARVVAVADTVGPRAEAVAGPLGARVFETADALLAGAEVDVVSICLPTDLHRAVAESAAAAGKHIFCEKPMALTVADCDAMIAAARAAGVVLSVGQVVRFFPEFANAKRLIDSGAVGTPAAIRTRRGGGFPHRDPEWFADVARSGGVVTDLLIHDLDWLLWCFGPVTRVYGQGLTERMAAGELPNLDYALLTLRHASGAISHAEGTWADPGGFVTTFEVVGDAGMLTHDSRRTAIVRRSGAAAENPLLADDDPYLRQIRVFADAVRNREAPPVTPEAARDAVALAEAARESIRTGRAIVLNQ